MHDFTYQFVKEVRRWADAKVPYRHRGVSMAGCDCTGLLIGVLQSLGYFKNYSLRNYPIDWNLHAKADDYLECEICKIANAIKNNDIQTGDIILFTFGKCVAHLGVVVDASSYLFVHQHRNARHTVYSTLRNSPWGARIAKVYRIDTVRLEKFS